MRRKINHVSLSEPSADTVDGITPTREFPPVQVERHGCDRTTDDGQGSSWAGARDCGLERIPQVIVIQDHIMHLVYSFVVIIMTL